MNTLHSIPIRRAITRGAQYLVDRQQPDGYWRDYCLPPGASTDWVTAYVGYALSGSACGHGEPIALGLSALDSSCRVSGWGYNTRVATDADSSAWATRWYARIGMPMPIDAVECLSSYLGDEGGARTFASTPRYGRWIQEHADVTAALGLALIESGADTALIARLRQWTLSHRNRDGLWTSFWWSFDGYAAALMLEFLAASGGIPRDVLDATQRYLRARSEPATAMEAASLLLLALRIGVPHERRLKLLLMQQRSDGSWPPSRCLKVPDQQLASDSEPLFEDGDGLMSTASSLSALQAALTRMSLQPDDRRRETATA
jgi:hypothetical protein